MNLEKLIKLFKLNEVQKSNLQLIINECENYHLSTPQASYVISTAWHESKFIPCEEIGKGKNKPYGKKIKYDGREYDLPNKLYYGRGFVQLTWYELYAKFGTILNLDLLKNPELALNEQIATKILLLGMTQGLFTGAKLSRFINGNKTDFIGARKIINGTDKADLIAGYAKKIMYSIS